MVRAGVAAVRFRYISSNALSSIPWAIPFGEGEIRTMIRQTEEIMGWYDRMQAVVPSWYA